ncbi:MAG: Ku protein [Saprospiraceae bacterium]|nr:Ku protein [Saprospiraceae bacterium]
MRSIWKGHIRFSLVTIPVQIFNAIESKTDIRFNQLHAKDHGRIKYKKECSVCNEEVPYAEIVKGYEYEPDQYVVMSRQDFDGIKLESNRAIEIEAFVNINEVHPNRFEAVYYVGPNGDIAQNTYSLLRETLLKTKKAGVGRIILREKEDVVLLVPEQKGIIMYKLRYPYELRSIKDMPDLMETSADQSQLQLAETLVDSLSKPFSEINFEDRYRDALLELVDDKIAGKEIVTVTETEDEGPVIDIMDALKRSIEEAKKKAG